MGIGRKKREEVWSFPEETENDLQKIQSRGPGVY
jgi:hypothetical protein